MRIATLRLLSGALLTVVAWPSQKVGASDTDTWYCNGRTTNYDTGEDPAYVNHHGDQWPVDGATWRGDMWTLRTHHETYSVYFQSHSGHTLCN
jgi:hypothetical protein